MDTTSQRLLELKETGPSAITTLSLELFQIVLRQQASNTWEEQQTVPAKPYSETLFPLMPLSAMIRASRSTA
jgi:hypothetical protein